MSEALVVKAVRRRHGVVTWFGSSSYRKLKVTYVARKMMCPFCGCELEDGDYSGCKVFAKDKHASDYVRDSWLPMFENGVKVWSVLPKRRFWFVETMNDADLLE
jgi:hypothetical protein